jgi:hypothetical protein
MDSERQNLPFEIVLKLLEDKEMRAHLIELMGGPQEVALKIAHAYGLPLKARTVPTH